MDAKGSRMGMAVQDCNHVTADSQMMVQVGSGRAQSHVATLRHVKLTWAAEAHDVHVRQ